MKLTEEGEMPSLIKVPGMAGMAGLKWTKKYIWRLNGEGSGEEDNGHTDPLAISVWFVKVSARMKMDQELQEDEADYLFHEFDFEFYKDPRSSSKTSTDVDENSQLGKDQDNGTAPETEISIAPPIPPLVPFLQPTVAEKTTILNARGQHLCINDMYRTAYSFRIRTDTGEVLSWASRTAVKGPKKNQDIINFYEREYSNLGDVT
jgi:Family of unknown function (DUF6314)